MKNSKFLRKLLSAVCCVAMLMTMLPVFPAAAAETAGTAISGGSLSSFSDAAEITYTKAAEITAGLGLFAGAGGKFMPKSNLTRAQMATIIVKMLYGADANADSFKGTGKFSDTAIFEGGWAEGYINWCATLGIVSGYGDGTFKPGNMVTAAEAATMILNALKVDAGAGEWPHTVMAKAEELDMFDELLTKPANDKPLTREELAVMALVGLEYSPDGKQGFEYNGVTYDSFMDAYMVAGAANAGEINPTQGDSLANKVFEMKTFEGYVVANVATDPALDGVTTVRKQVDGVNVDKDFFITTGLEHIGHYVTVYYSETYSSDMEPGLTYTVYDETQVFTVDEDITSAKEYKAVFDRSYEPANQVALFGDNYMVTDIDGTLPNYAKGSAAKAGTYFVYDGAIVAYMASVPVYASKVTAVNTYAGGESISLLGVAYISNSEDDDRVVEYAGIAKDDYVTYTVVGEEGSRIYVLSKTTSTTGTVSKLSNNEDGKRVATVNGGEYVAFDAKNNATDLHTEDISDFTATYTFYITADGKYLGWEKADGAADLDNTVFILGELSMDKADEYGKMTRTVYARGVDMDGKEVMLPVKTVRGDNYDKGQKEFVGETEIIEDDGCDKVKTKTFYYIKESTQKEPKKDGLYVLTAITSEYDEKTQPIYYGSNVTEKDDKFSQNVLLSETTVYAAPKSSTLYIAMEGEFDQTEPLTATVQNSFKTGVPNNTGNDVTRYCLVSKNGANTELEVVLFCAEGVNDLLSDKKTIVYVSDAAVADHSRDTDGYVYDVYDYQTGAVKQITMEKLIAECDSFDGAGFYQIAPVIDAETVELEDKGKHSSYVGTDSNDNSDGLFYVNVSYDQVLAAMSSTFFYTRNARDFGTDPSDYKDYCIRNGKGAADAIVVDLRSEEDIVAHGVGKINSLSRVLDLIGENDKLVIPMDMCYSTDDETLLTVFVKDVYGTDWLYPITVEQSEGGTVSANVEKAKVGDTVILSNESESEEYALAYYLVDGKPLEGDTFVMGSDPVTVSAVFTKGYEVMLTQPSFGAIISSDVEYAGVGAKVTITATCTVSFYELTKVTVTTEDGDPVETTITADKLAATFMMPDADVYVSVTLADVSVVQDDDFEDYVEGSEFKDDATAKENGWIIISGKPEDIIKNEDNGNTYLFLGSEKAYLQPVGETVPEGAYKLKFDMMRAAELSGTLYVLLGTYGADKEIQFIVLENGVFGFNDSGEKPANFVALAENGQISSNCLENKDALNAKTAAKLDENTWYTVELTVDAAKEKIGIKVYEREVPENVKCDGQYAKAFDNTAVHLQPKKTGIGTGSQPSVGIDNVTITKIWKAD